MRAALRLGALTVDQRIAPRLLGEISLPSKGPSQSVESFSQETARGPQTVFAKMYRLMAGLLSDEQGNH
jgi:hypothetical protein